MLEGCPTTFQTTVVPLPQVHLALAALHWDIMLKFGEALGELSVVDFACDSKLAVEEWRVNQAAGKGRHAMLD